ncbi:MAG: sigma-70 family RNA polymerase sigma factor [Ruminococcaceae bacterium]|nr:sigma-70 family RNA polymerase sigma factor [Oscillospiraceae bacterium]
MNQLDITFDPAPWEGILGGLPRGAELSAARFLTLMEPESEDAVMDALELLEEKDILLSLGDLPQAASSAEMAVRLRQEAQLCKENRLPHGLEENDPLRLYLEELAAMPTSGDSQVLAEQSLAGDENARFALTNLMLGQVVRQSFSLAGQGVLLMDLIQEGSLALWKAILEYTGGDFESYCCRCIRRTLAKTVVLQARANGVGQRLRQAMEDYRSVDERLLGELGRNPTLEEIADALHMTPEVAASVAENLEAARMMSRAKAQPEDTPQEEEQAVEDTAYFQMRQRISELLSSLEEADVQLLNLRFGLEGGLPMSPEETGKRLGLTASEVVAREAAALTKLRKEG